MTIDVNERAQIAKRFISTDEKQQGTAEPRSIRSLESNLDEYNGYSNNSV